MGGFARVAGFVISSTIVAVDADVLIEPGELVAAAGTPFLSDAPTAASR